jgi:hypothetical protein
MLLGGALVDLSGRHSYIYLGAFNHTKKTMSHKFYVFTNKKDRKLLAVTHDREGGKLPEGSHHWKYWKEFIGGLSGRAAFGLTDATAANTALEQQGYYLWNWPCRSKTAA